MDVRERGRPVDRRAEPGGPRGQFGAAAGTEGALLEAEDPVQAGGIVPIVATGEHLGVSVETSIPTFTMVPTTAALTLPTGEELADRTSTWLSARCVRKGATFWEQPAVVPRTRGR